MDAMVPTTAKHVGAALVDAARGYVDASLAPKTRKLYSTAWRQFTNWCAESGFCSMPADPRAVALYLSARAEAELAVSTIRIDVAAIGYAHEAADHASPTTHKIVRSVMAGITRTTGTMPKRKKPVLTGDLRKMVNAVDATTTRGLRDRAVLVVGFASALRRKELVAVQFEHIEFVEDGVKLLVPKSKTDQERHGRTIALPWGSRPSTCPVRALRTWLTQSGITSGPVFRSISRSGKMASGAMSARGVARAVKRAGAAAGLDPGGLGGHSLRAGFATSAARAGATERAIAKQTGHKNMAVLRTYIRDGRLFEDSAAGLLGL